MHHPLTNRITREELSALVARVAADCRAAGDRVDVARAAARAILSQGYAATVLHMHGYDGPGRRHLRYNHVVAVVVGVAPISGLIVDLTGQGLYDPQLPDVLVIEDYLDRIKALTGMQYAVSRDVLSATAPDTAWAALREALRQPATPA